MAGPISRRRRSMISRRRAITSAALTDGAPLGIGSAPSPLESGPAPYFRKGLNVHPPFHGPPGVPGAVKDADRWAAQGAPRWAAPRGSRWFAQGAHRWVPPPAVPPVARNRVLPPVRRLRR